MKKINPALTKLTKNLQGDLFDSEIIRSIYSTDASMFKRKPYLVGCPKSDEDVFHLLEYAKKNNLKITPRGAGTGLAGESLGQGLILDFSRYYNEVLTYSPEHQQITVRSGVVHGVLNQFLAKDHLLFGPDPATSNRCTLGGMIANNSTGAHSIKYGMTNQWITNLKVMLSDGSIINTSIFPDDLNKTKLDLNKLKNIILANTELIKHTWPQTPRNRHGYLLYNIIKQGGFDFSQLFMASEGTLGIILEATLELSKTEETNLISLHFENRFDALEAAHLLLSFKPSAVEIIDDVCLSMARQNKIYASLFPDNIKSILLVELPLHDDVSMGRICAEITTSLNDHHLPHALKNYVNLVERETAWNLRKQVAGLINRVPGLHQPLPFIEDVCVDPKNLREYIQGVENILFKYDLKYLTFGHAGDGTVHLRPFLNLRDEKILKILPEICEEVYNHTLRMKGTISGEHGDGYLRGPFIKKQYGLEMFELFKEIKSLLDPTFLLNPDKKTGTPQVETWKDFIKFLDYQIDPSYRPDLCWDHHQLIEEIDKCNGCAGCRSMLDDVDMCPVFKSTRFEGYTPRAKVNTIKAIMQKTLSAFDYNELGEIFNYCVGCGRCEENCPSNVSVKKLIYEMRSLINKNTHKKPSQIFINHLSKIILNLSIIPSLANTLNQLPLLKLIQSKLLNLDTKREFPKIQKRLKIKLKPAKMIYFSDIYAGAVNPHIASNLEKIFAYNGIEISIPGALNSGVIEFTYANTQDIKKIIKSNLKGLIPHIEKGSNIIFTEPSALLMLTQEYKHLLQNREIELLKNHCVFYADFLLTLHKKGLLRPFNTSLNYEIAYHYSCHQKKLSSVDCSIKLLSKIDGLKIHPLKSGCCGLSGTFGITLKNKEVSDLIAQKKLYELNHLSYDFIVSDCGSCLMQLKHLMPQKSQMHSIELISKGYGF